MICITAVLKLRRLKINKREFLSKKVITRHIHPKGNHSWLARISACDIKNDGNMDLVLKKLERVIISLISQINLFMIGAKLIKLFGLTMVKVILKLLDLKTLCILKMMKGLDIRKIKIISKDF